MHIKDIGGFKGSGFNSPDDLVKNLDMWKIKVRDGKVIAGKMYKDRSGRKAVCSFTDGSQDGKNALKEMILADVTRAYSETSSKMLWFIVKTYGIQFVKQHAIPVEQVQKLLPNDSVNTDHVDNDYLTKYPELKDYFYSRKLGGEEETNITLGTPNKTIKKV